MGCTVGMTKADRLVYQACVVIRATVLGQACLAVLVEDHDFHRAPVTWLLITAAAVESAWLGWLLLTRQGQAMPRIALVDVCFGVLALVVGSWAAPANASHFWGNVMYPLTLISSGAVAAALFARMRGTLLASAALAAAYGISMISFHRMQPTYVVNVSIDMLTYVPFAWVARWLATHARSLGRHLDQVQEEAVERTKQLTEDREQVKYQQKITALRLTAAQTALTQERARLESLGMLHDRVLQTLEALAREDVLADMGLRSHVASEARWLRRLIERGGPPEDGCVADRLWSIAEDFERRGLRVELSTADLTVVIGEDVMRALTEAAREVLNNVAKHSGVTSAVVRAVEEPGRVRVTVVDRGHGFRPDEARWNTGLERSVKARLEAVGGGFDVESAPGEGTRVRMWVPM